MENLDLVYQKSSHSQSSTHPRSAERGSRQAISPRPDHSNRMVPPSSFPNYMQQVASTSDLFAMRFNNKLPQFVSPVPDSLAVAVDALSLQWEDLDAYAFPPAAILGKVVEKLQDSPCKRIILIAPGWPNMPWFWDLVTMSSQTPLSLPNLLTQPFNQSPHKSDKLKSPCMAPRASAIKEQGFSEAVAARIEAPQRGSTRSVYEAKWTIFTNWCLTNQVDFRAPPVKSVADFLMYLFEDRKLQPSTIDGYRSAKMKISLASWIAYIETDPRVEEVSLPGTYLWSYTS